jgi:hypothetical protein
MTVDDPPQTPTDESSSLINSTIGGTVKQLNRLSRTTRESATASRNRKMAEYTENEEANTAIEELRHHTDDYIRSRFPQAPESLRLALIEGNALRLRRLYYQMSHRRRIPLASHRPPSPPSMVKDTIRRPSAPVDSTVEVPRANPVPASNECPYCGVIVESQGIRESTLWE